METINGVERYKPTCNSKSLYNHTLAFTHITIERRTLEREIFRLIEDTMTNGGNINEIALRYMTALDADEQAEMQERIGQVQFTFDTDIVRETWQRGL